VDLLLVMPCKRRPLDQALEIRLTSKNKRSEE